MADGSSGGEQPPDTDRTLASSRETRGEHGPPHLPEQEAGEPSDNLTAPVGILTAVGLGLLLWIVIIGVIIWLV